jgi:hypothetical protein
MTPDVLNQTLLQIQHSGRRQAISLSQFDQYFHPRQFLLTLQQAAGDSCSAPYRQLQSAFSDVAGLRRIATTSASAAMVQSKVATTVDSDRDEQAWKTVVQIVDSAEFEIRLLICHKEEWTAVASYSCKQGRARRSIYYVNGDRRPCFLDLPPQVVLDMAKEDFARNWLDYYREFLQAPDQRSWFPCRE